MKFMKRIYYNTLISILSFTFFAGSTFAADLPQGKWQLDGYNFKRKIVYPIDKKAITLNINEDGKLGGRSGCNVYGGSYAFENDALKISDIFSTMMACDEMTMAFEQTYYRVLSSANDHKLEKGLLTIIDNKTLEFVRFRQAPEKQGEKEKAGH